MRRAATSSATCPGMQNSCCVSTPSARTRVSYPPSSCRCMQYVFDWQPAANRVWTVHADHGSSQSTPWGGSITYPPNGWLVTNTNCGNVCNPKQHPQVAFAPGGVGTVACTNDQVLTGHDCGFSTQAECEAWSQALPPVAVSISQASPIGVYLNTDSTNPIVGSPNPGWSVDPTLLCPGRIHDSLSCMTHQPSRCLEPQGD